MYADDFTCNRIRKSSSSIVSKFAHVSRGYAAEFNYIRCSLQSNGLNSCAINYSEF